MVTAWSLHHLVWRGLRATQGNNHATTTVIRRVTVRGRRGISAPSARTINSDIGQRRNDIERGTAAGAV